MIDHNKRDCIILQITVFEPDNTLRTQSCGHHVYQREQLFRCLSPFYLQIKSQFEFQL